MADPGQDTAVSITDWVQSSCAALGTGQVEVCQRDLDELLAGTWLYDLDLRTAFDVFEHVLEVEESREWLVSLAIVLTSSESLAFAPPPGNTLAELHHSTPPGIYLVDPVLPGQMPFYFEAYQAGFSEFRPPAELPPEISVRYTCQRALEGREQGWEWDRVIWCDRWPAPRRL